VIRSFSCKETEKIWKGSVSKKLPSEIQAVARRKLRMLNSAQEWRDLQIPPANRLERLKGRLVGYCSIRINDQWRIVFRWDEGDVFETKIMDYHK
jgi:toxin HigB-1